MDIAASRRPAGHPSVRSRSTLTCSAARRIPAPSNSSAVSDSVNARSAVRISVRDPLTRSRCNRSIGSLRLTSTNRSAGGRWSTNSPNVCRTVSSVISWRSSRISTTGAGSSARSARTSKTSAGPNLVAGAMSRRPLRSGTPPLAFSAKITLDQNDRGLSSAESRLNQPAAPGTLPDPTQDATINVLPAPGPALTSVTGPPAAAVRRSWSRPRRTKPGGTAGGRVLSSMTDCS